MGACLEDEDDCCCCCIDDGKIVGTDGAVLVGGGGGGGAGFGGNIAFCGGVGSDDATVSALLIKKSKSKSMFTACLIGVDGSIIYL
jgi:hypothetical protein